MAGCPPISEATIRDSASPESFTRGVRYYAQGAVGELRLRGAVLTADVEGSSETPYRVTLNLGAAGITAAACTCPYDWGGWCKHIVAVALKCSREPGEVEALQPIDQLLSGLTREQLVALLTDIANDDPELAASVDRRVTLMQLAAAQRAKKGAGAPAAKGKAAQRRSPIDQQQIRQQVRAILREARRGRYDGYDEETPGEEAAEQLNPLLEQARRFTEGGDGRSALAVLEALTDTYLDAGRRLFAEVEEIYGSLEGPAVELLADIARAWAEALLTADLTDDELDTWGETVAGLQDQAADIGEELDDVFAIALTAAEQGWAYPPLRAALRGQFGEQGAWEGAAPDYADELALIRLRVLDRQGRHEEYLNLAQAEGQLDRYAAMLARLGRTEEALAAAIADLTTTEELREIAGLLREAGDLEGALRLAEHAVKLKPPPDIKHPASFYGLHQVAELAAWAADLASGMGLGERAVAAATEAFRASPSLAAYQRAQTIAGDRWSEVAPGLLAALRRSPNAQAKVDVFLHEQLIDDAIKAVEKGYDDELLRRVMTVALDSRPDWVARAATAKATPIMDAAKSTEYTGAADWLRRARDALRAAGREDEWHALIADVRSRHARKYRLIALLSTL